MLMMPNRPPRSAGRRSSFGGLAGRSQSQRRDGVCAVGNRRRSGRSSRTDRAHSLLHTDASDPSARRGVLGFRLVRQGGLYSAGAGRRERAGRPRLEWQPSVRGDVLLRYRSAVRSRAPRSGSIPVQDVVGRSTRRRFDPDAVHGVSGHLGALPVRRNESREGVGFDHLAAGRDSGGALFQRRGVRVGVGVAGHRVGEHPAGRTTSVGRRSDRVLPFGDRARVHELRSSGDGVRGGWVVGVGTQAARARGNPARPGRRRKLYPLLLLGPLLVLCLRAGKTRTGW